MTSAWKSAEDIKNTLWLFSEISEQEDNISEPPPNSIMQWNARIGATNNCSIFDTHVTSEDVTYVSSGRGRGGLSTIFRPGIPVKDTREDEQQIYRKIREVSGLGYSNELIEKSFRKQTLSPNEEHEFCDALEMKNTKLLEFQCKTPVSERCSPMYLPNNAVTDSAPIFSSGTSSPVGITSEINSSPINEHPPPLSVILGKGKKKDIQKTSNTVNGTKMPETGKSKIGHKNYKSVIENTKTKNYRLNPEAPEFKLSGFMSPELLQKMCGPVSSTNELCNNNTSDPNLFSDVRNIINSSENGKNGLGRKTARSVDTLSPTNKWMNFNCGENRTPNDSPLCWKVSTNKTFDIKSKDDFPML